MFSGDVLALPREASPGGCLGLFWVWKKEAEMIKTKLILKKIPVSTLTLVLFSITSSVGVVSSVLPVHLILWAVTVLIRMDHTVILEGDGHWTGSKNFLKALFTENWTVSVRAQQSSLCKPGKNPKYLQKYFKFCTLTDRWLVSTFAVPVELLLLPAELVVKLTVKLHLQHLSEH